MKQFPAACCRIESDRQLWSLFAAAAEAASNGEEQTQTSPENGTRIARSRTIEICDLEQCSRLRVQSARTTMPFVNSSTGTVRSPGYETGLCIVSALLRNLAFNSV
jgi:hypothetical protein